MLIALLNILCEESELTCYHQTASLSTCVFHRVSTFRFDTRGLLVCPASVLFCEDQNCALPVYWCHHVHMLSLSNPGNSQ